MCWCRWELGTPEKCKILIDHLEFKGRDQYIFVDPGNKLYDSLLLNRGVKETFFSIETPMAFLDRFTKPGGTKELREVLSKWNKAFFIPPRQDLPRIHTWNFLHRILPHPHMHHQSTQPWRRHSTGSITGDGTIQWIHHPNQQQARRPTIPGTLSFF